MTRLTELLCVATGGVLPKHRDGCLITSVAKHSCSEGKLEVGDVLISIDGTVVSEKSDVVYRGQERLPWQYCISTKSVGESVELTVLRKSDSDQVQKTEDGAGAQISLDDDGRHAEELKISLDLTAVPRLLPRVYGIDYQSTYVIVGGLVILPAGLPLQDAALAHPRRVRTNAQGFLFRNSQRFLERQTVHRSPQQVLCVLLTRPVHLSGPLVRSLRCNPNGGPDWSVGRARPAGLPPCRRASTPHQRFL